MDDHAPMKECDEGWHERCECEIALNHAHDRQPIHNKNYNTNRGRWILTLSFDLGFWSVAWNVFRESLKKTTKQVNLNT